MSAYSTTTQANALYYANTIKLNEITAPNNSVSLNSQKITNLLDPTSN